MFLRALYIVIAILAVIVGYKAYDIHGVRKSAEQAEASHVIGPDEAQTSVVMFMDYQCPYCKDIYPSVIEAIGRDGDARLVIRLLASMDDETMRVSRLAYAAGMQGKFQEMHDILIRHYGPFDNLEMKSTAEEAGLDVERWLADAESDEVKEKIEENIALARKLRVYATPTFLIGNIIYTPIDKMPETEDFLRMFAESRGVSP